MLTPLILLLIFFALLGLWVWQQHQRDIQVATILLDDLEPMIQATPVLALCQLSPNIQQLWRELYTIPLRKILQWDLDSNQTPNVTLADEQQHKKISPDIPVWGNNRRTWLYSYLKLLYGFAQRCKMYRADIIALQNNPAQINQQERIFKEDMAETLYDASTFLLGLLVSHPSATSYCQELIDKIIRELTGRDFGYRIIQFKHGMVANEQCFLLGSDMQRPHQNTIQAVYSLYMATRNPPIQERLCLYTAEGN